MKFGIFSQIWIPYSIVTLILFFVLISYYPKQQETLISEVKTDELLHIAQTLTLGVEISLDRDDYLGLEKTMNFVQSEQKADFLAVILTSDEREQPDILFRPDSINIQELLQDTTHYIVVRTPFTTSSFKGEIAIGFNRFKITEQLEHINEPIKILLILLALVALIIVYAMANQISQPVIKLTELSEQLATGSYVNAEIQPKVRSFELKRLQVALHDLASKLSIERSKNSELTQNLEKKIKEQTTGLENLLKDLNVAQEIAHFANFKFHVTQDKLEGSENLQHLLGMDNITNTGRKTILKNIKVAGRIELVKNILQSIEYGTPLKTEFEWRRPIDGKVITLECIFNTNEYVTRDIIHGVIQDISERKKQEEELYILSNVAKRTSNLVIITDTKKNITWVNESVESITGYSREDLIGKTPKIFQGPMSDPETIAYINANLSQEKSVYAEIINYDKHGKPYWVVLNIEPLFDGGKLTGYMAVESEISEKKKLEIAQKETIQKLEATRKQISQINSDLEKTIEEKTQSIKNLALIPQHNPNPVMELNMMERKINFYNHAAENYLSEVLSSSFDDIVKFLKIDHKGQLINENDRENTAGQKIFEITTFILEGDSLCRVYLHDITLRKENELQLSLVIDQLKSTESALVKKTQQLEESLIELEKAQSDLLNKERLSTLGVLIAGIAHEINSPLGAIKASGENLEQLFKDSFEEIIWQLQPNEILLALDLYKQRKTINLTTREERERIQQINRLLTDILDSEADRMSCARAFVQMGIVEITHSIADILKEPKFKQIIRLALNFSLVYKSIRTTTISADQSSKVVKALNVFAHGNINAEITEFNLRESFETVITIFWNKIKQGATVNNDIPEDIVISGYADELTQVWTNLINNALYASGNKCTIRIRLEEDPQLHIIRISNNGPQIPPEIIHRIFEPFFTTKARGEGTGLGLNIVQGVIEKHGGKIRCESTPELTTFTIELPKVIRAKAS